MLSPVNAPKHQISPFSLSQSGTKRMKINRPWPISNLFWRWSGYISMPNCSFLGNAQKPLRKDRWTARPKNDLSWSDLQTDSCAGGRMVFQAPAGRPAGRDKWDEWDRWTGWTHRWMHTHMYVCTYAWISAVNLYLNFLSWCLHFFVCYWTYTTIEQEDYMNGQAKNIMPQAPKSGGIKELCQME